MAKFFQSLKHCAAGIRVVLAERNMRLHVVVAVLVIATSAWLGLSPIEWALIVICIGGVLVLESVNTAIEKLADRITQSQDLLIKQAKDVSAAAVLLMAITAASIGLIVLGPKILAAWG